MPLKALWSPSWIGVRTPTTNSILEDVKYKFNYVIPIHILINRIFREMITLNLADTDWNVVSDDLIVIAVFKCNLTGHFVTKYNMYSISKMLINNLKTQYNF